MRLAKAWFDQVVDHVGQTKDQDGQGQGQELDNIFSITFRTEYYTYDSNDLIGAVGGYFGTYHQPKNLLTITPIILGLFLGWSVLSILLWSSDMVLKFWTYMKTYIPFKK